MKKTPEISLDEALRRAEAKLHWGPKALMTLRAAVESGQIPSTQRGTQRYVRYSDVLKWEESLRVY